MSMRITVMDKRSNNSPRSFYQYRPIWLPNMSNESIYVRPSRHLSRRSQSPFKKYEECIKQKMTSLSPKCEPWETNKGRNYSNNFEKIGISPDFRSNYQHKDQNYILCSNCKSKISNESETVEKLETLKIEEPLGTPDPEEKHFDFLDERCFDVHLNTETAEQFINLLIAEDKMLRQKISNGDIDEKTMRKLDRLAELRRKYNDFKNSKKKIVEIPIIHEKSEKKNSSMMPLKKFSNATISKISSKPMRKKFDLGLSKIKSLSDPDFSLELSRHPLVRE